MTKRIATLLCSAVLAAASPALSDDVPENVAASIAPALQLQYAKVYSGAPCAEKKVGSRWYVKCAPSGMVGGIWAIARGPTLVPMNGKARTHADDIGLVILGSGEIVPVKEWRDVFPNEIPDVASVIKAYE